MDNRIQQLQQFAKLMSSQSPEERKYAPLVFEAAELIANDRVDHSLAIEMDIFSAWLLARSRTKESHLLAEAATLLKGSAIVPQVDSTLPDGGMFDDKRHESTRA
jgi:hypothetical protein